MQKLNLPSDVDPNSLLSDPAYVSYRFLIVITRSLAIVLCPDSRSMECVRGKRRMIYRQGFIPRAWTLKAIPETVLIPISCGWGSIMSNYRFSIPNQRNRNSFWMAFPVKHLAVKCMGSLEHPAGVKPHCYQWSAVESVDWNRWARNVISGHVQLNNTLMKYDKINHCEYLRCLLGSSAVIGDIQHFESSLDSRSTKGVLWGKSEPIGGLSHVDRIWVSSDHTVCFIQKCCIIILYERARTATGFVPGSWYTHFYRGCNSKMTVS